MEWGHGSFWKAELMKRGSGKWCVHRPHGRQRPRRCRLRDPSSRREGREGRAGVAPVQPPHHWGALGVFSHSSPCPSTSRLQLLPSSGLTRAWEASTRVFGGGKGPRAAGLQASTWPSPSGCPRAPRCQTLEAAGGTACPAPGTRHPRRDPSSTFRGATAGTAHGSHCLCFQVSGTTLQKAGRLGDPNTVLQFKSPKRLHSMPVTIF